MEALFFESSITAEGSAKVPDTDEDDLPNPIGTEDRLDALDQILDLVSDTSLSYGPEARDIADSRSKASICSEPSTPMPKRSENLSGN